MCDTSKPSAHVCAQCHQLGQGCCFSFGDTSQIFALLPTEIDRMAGASRIPAERFTVQDKISHEFKQILLSLHPALAATAPGNLRVRLKTLANGHCFFLTSEGCALPVTARPYYCRLYPLWFMPDGRMLVLMNPNCLAQKKAAGWRQVLERLAVDEAELRALFNEYIELVTAK